MGVVIRRAVLLGGLSCLWAGAVRAQGANIGTFSLVGSPATLNITTATAGLDPNSVSSIVSYSVKAAKSNKPQKVTAQLNANLPAGVTLTLNLVAPAGATSNGAVALDATVRDLVGNITNTTATVQNMTYTLSATAAAGAIPLSATTVTFTITSYP